MKRRRFGTYALMVSVVLWGVLIGGATYAALVYFPAYLSHLPESAVVVTGPYGLSEGIFWMAIHPLLILSLIVSLVTNWSSPRRRKLIATSFLIYIGVLIATWTYFLPELSAFKLSQESGLSNADWQGRTGRWQILNIVRAALLFGSMFPLLTGLAQPDAD